ncbi:MAG TPA: 50S ribosomal protein L25 [Candidatus Methylomirabilis sp.]|nr:50S ribosomal protein L25 [Candidatus Methylomirabilis sp.]
MESLTLTATSRTQTGRQATQVRASNNIPAVIYGHGVEARAISIPFPEFRKVYAKAGSSSLVDVKVDDGATVKAIIQEVQLHHLTMLPMHVDFHQVRMDEKMHANVPLVFTGESAAVKSLGGTLVKTLDAVEVECLPADLPHTIEVELAVLVTFDDAVSVADLKLPKGVTILTDANQTIATVEAPLTEEELKKLEESQLGDVTAVKSEGDIKKAEEEAKAAAEAEASAKE